MWVDAPATAAATPDVVHVLHPSRPVGWNSSSRLCGSASDGRHVTKMVRVSLVTGASTGPARRLGRLARRPSLRETLGHRRERAAHGRSANALRSASASARLPRPPGAPAGSGRRRRRASAGSSGSPSCGGWPPRPRRRRPGFPVSRPPVRGSDGCTCPPPGTSGCRLAPMGEPDAGRRTRGHGGGRQGRRGGRPRCAAGCSSRVRKLRPARSRDDRAAQKRASS